MKYTILDITTTTAITIIKFENKKNAVIIMGRLARKNPHHKYTIVIERQVEQWQRKRKKSMYPQSADWKS